MTKIEVFAQTYRRLHWLSVFVLAALVTLTPGCASVPGASHEVKQQALSFTPPTGMAGLYVIREWHMEGAAVLFNIQLDYQRFGSLETSSFLYSPILPGKHFLRMGVKGGPHNGAVDYGLTTFVAEPGKNYYYSDHFSMVQHMFDPMPEADAQKDIRKFKMSGATTYKPPSPP